MEEIRNVPKEPAGNNTKNTAVYGTDESKKENEATVNSNDLGYKMLNGAIQLAESGYKNSSVIAAKETFRNHPETKSLVKDRLYFVDILIDLGLFEEANAELYDIKKYDLNDDERNDVDRRIEEIRQKLISK